MTQVDSVFTVAYGNKLDMNKMVRTDKQSGIAFVGRRGGLVGSSGVSGYVAPLTDIAPYLPGCITVALGGSRLLSSYVQQRPFYTAQNVAVLTPRDPEMPVKDRLYYAMCIRANAFRYTAFGREANRTLAIIDLPDAVPEWVANTPIPSHEGLAKASLTNYVQFPDPTGAAWRDFILDDLFEIKKGKRLTKADRSPGNTRFVGASEKRNGITDMASVPANFDGNCLTVVYNGNSVGYAFYQVKPFFACDDVNVLIPREPISKWGQMFVAAVIKRGRSRFTYGYKWTLARMKKTTVRLPVTEQGQPDWQFMEQFMRSLPFSAAVEQEAASTKDVIRQLEKLPST